MRTQHSLDAALLRWGGGNEYDVPPQEDLQLVQEAGAGRVGITVGSALDIFGGGLAFDAVLKWHRRLEQADT